MFCGKVKEFLSENKIEFVDHNIAADESALAELERLGYMTTPVTVIDGEVVVVSTRAGHPPTVVNGASVSVSNRSKGKLATQSLNILEVLCS